jgi:hypothetical protein
VFFEKNFKSFSKKTICGRGKEKMEFFLFPYRTLLSSYQVLMVVAGAVIFYALPNKTETKERLIGIFPAIFCQWLK